MGFTKIKVFFSEVFASKGKAAYNYDSTGTPREIHNSQSNPDANAPPCEVHSSQSNPDANAQCSEIEIISKLLLSETRGDLWHHYQRSIRKFSVDENPLAVSDAKLILCSLLLKATAKRRMFPTRIAHSVESGSIFNKYFGKMEYINQLSVITYRKMKKMQTAREKYNDEKKRLDKIADVSYKENFDQSGNVNQKKRNQQVVDIWEKMDIEGDEVEYESSRETRND